MLILGIDPSKDTGLALVDFRNPSRPVVVWTVFIHLTAAERKAKTDQEQQKFILLAVGHKVAMSRVRSHKVKVAIEFPMAENAQRQYSTKAGKAGSRAITSAFQWRLIGALEAACQLQGVEVVRVYPAQGKAAVGASQTGDKESVAQGVKKITDHDFGQDPKYARYACADAIAVAIAGHGIIQARKVENGSA